MKIKIEELDLSLQTRAGTDAETIDNYAEAMADGAQFPEVTVFTDGTHYWLADGFHRVMAAKQNGRTAIAADVRKGTEDDAVVFGGTANNKQGKRPTRADVQHFLQMVWDRREAIFGGTPTGGEPRGKVRRFEADWQSICARKVGGDACCTRPFTYAKGTGENAGEGRERGRFY